MDFDEYQSEAKKTIITPERDAFIYGLISEMGEIFSAYKKLVRDVKNKGVITISIRRELEEQIGDTLWYLSSIATAVDIKLSDAAKKNLSKTVGLFGNQDYQLYDDEEIESEKFPRVFNLEFSIENDRVSMILDDGSQIGDAIDSNAHIEDNYKYHDVFHIAFLAVLGWSPVIRSLMNRKRKSRNKDIDRVEDGARAKILEEAVSALIFERNKEYGPFTERDNIPVSLIVTIKQIVAGLEVSSRNVQDWQKAIVTGFNVFEEISSRKKGKITVDLVRREVRFID